MANDAEERQDDPDRDQKAAAAVNDVGEAGEHVSGSIGPGGAACRRLEVRLTAPTPHLRREPLELRFVGDDTNGPRRREQCADHGCGVEH